MSHVTYLLGAGASINALPDNKKLLSSLHQIVHSANAVLKNTTELNYLETFKNTYLPLIKEAQAEISLDTLANINFNNEDKLHQIKVLIWLFFSGQAGKKQLDPRYKHLLINIRDYNSSSFRVRDNFSFLSWNYDLQLEEAYSILAETDIWRVPNSLYSFPGIHFIKPNALNSKSSPDLFQLIHLNGCGGYYYDQEINSYNNWYNCDFDSFDEYEKMLRLIIQKFHTNNSKRNALTNCINFAGEDSPLNEMKKKYVSKVSEKTTHLIVIGYSFPYFNRQMDKEIIDKMDMLEYIFIQDPNADDLEIKIRLRYPLLASKIDERKILIYKDKKCDEFHYPYNID